MSIKKVSHNYVYVIIGVKNWINIVNPGATRGPGGGQAGFCMGEPHIKSHPSGGSRITLARIDLYLLSTVLNCAFLFRESVARHSSARRPRDDASAP